MHRVLRFLVVVGLASLASEAALAQSPVVRFGGAAVPLRAAGDIASTTIAAPTSVHDFTGDGRLDLVFLVDKTLFLCRGDGAGGFLTAEETPVPKAYNVSPDLQNFAVADLDGDGDVDVAHLGNGPSAGSTSCAS